MGTASRQSGSTSHESKVGWEDFYRQELPRLWRSLVVYSQSSDIASDAAAEAFARSLTQWERIRDPVAWLYRVAFRIAAREMRLRDAAIQSPPVELTEYDDSDSGLDVLAALAELTPAQRSAVLLGDYYDFTAPEIGNMLRCAASTVRVHQVRGRRRLKKLIERSGEWGDSR